jgi:hypothetical protein
MAHVVGDRKAGLTEAARHATERADTAAGSISSVIGIGRRRSEAEQQHALWF